MMGHMNSLTTLKLFLQHSDKDTSGAAGKAVADWISSRLTNLQSLTFGVIQEAKPAKEATKETEPAAAKETEPTISLLPGLVLVEHHELFELYLLGQLNRPIWRQLLPGSLRVLTLSNSKVKTDIMPELGGLLRNLRTLRLLAYSFLCKNVCFAKDGFPSLKILKIWKLPQLEKVTIVPGAMLHLKELEFRHLDAMTTVEGIEGCNELENICVESQDHTLVDQLEKKILHVQNVTKRPRSSDNEEDDRDEKGEIFCLRVEKKSQSVNDDIRYGTKRKDDHLNVEKHQEVESGQQQQAWNMSFTHGDENVFID